MQSTSTGAPTARMCRRLVGAMALASGLVVANSYYAQPLVGAVADSLDASTTQVGWVVTAGQIGYAAGLALLVPLGDMVERRRLLRRMLVLTAAGLLVMAWAPSWQILAATAVLVSTGSVVGQILVPFAASLARDDERGRVIGNVMTGLLLGILLSRVVAGLVAEIAGWRAVFVLAAVLMLCTVLLVQSLPVLPPATTAGYRTVLASVVCLIRDEPVLRSRIAYGALTYASFGGSGPVSASCSPDRGTGGPRRASGSSPSSGSPARWLHGRPASSPTAATRAGRRVCSSPPPRSVSCSSPSANSTCSHSRWASPCWTWASRERTSATRA